MTNEVARRHKNGFSGLAVDALRLGTPWGAAGIRLSSPGAPWRSAPGTCVPRCAPWFIRQPGRPGAALPIRTWPQHSREVRTSVPANAAQLQKPSPLDCPLGGPKRPRAHRWASAEASLLSTDLHRESRGGPGRQVDQGHLEKDINWIKIFVEIGFVDPQFL